MYRAATSWVSSSLHRLCVQGSWLSWSAPVVIQELGRVQLKSRESSLELYLVASRNRVAISGVKQDAWSLGYCTLFHFLFRVEGSFCVYGINVNWTNRFLVFSLKL